MSLRVGTDLVAVESVQASMDAHGAHYLRRVYTPAEVADCSTARGVDAQRLAARFAAKEAAMKVLRPSAQDSVPWPAIEVRRQPGGHVELALSGPAAALADEAGVISLALSLSHEQAYASAVVVAELRDDDQRGTDA